MSLDDLTDSFFSCGETPVWLPTDMTLDQIPPYGSAVLRLTSLTHGTGKVTPRVDGLLIDENTTISFSVNGIQQSLGETILMLKGAHKLPGRSDVCAAELVFYFRTERGSWIALCLPCDIGAGPTNEYFKTLGDGLARARPLVTSLFSSDSKFLTYNGADIRGRSVGNAVPRALCQPVVSVVTYYVCQTPSLISSLDYARLMNLAGTKRKGPPEPLMVSASPTRVRRLCSVITGIRLVSKHGGGGGGSKGSSGIPTSAMKCYPLVPDRDIVGDRIYVNGKGRPFPDGSNGDQEGEGLEGSIKPATIRKWLGIILGVTIGIIICSLFFVWLYRHVFKDYLANATLYSSPTLSMAAVSSSLPLLSLPRICPEVPSAASAASAPATPTA